MTAAPIREGIFEVAAQKERQPVIVVDNGCDVGLQLILNGPRGSVITLEVPEHTVGRVEAPTGHYEAKVVDPKGRIRSAIGTADIVEYKSYRTGFVVRYNTPTYLFHIGK